MVFFHSLKSKQSHLQCENQLKDKYVYKQQNNKYSVLTAAGAVSTLTNHLMIEMIFV